MREVGFQDAAGVGSELGFVQFFVSQLHHSERFFDVAGILVTLDDFLGAVDCGEVGAAFHVVAGNGDFVTAQSVHQFCHALGCVGGVFALRIALYQFGKRLVCAAVGFRVTVGPVLRGEFVEEGLVFVEQNQAFEVKRVIHIRMLRVMALEAVDGGEGFFRLVVFVIGVCGVQLRLLRVAAVGEADSKISYNLMARV